MTFTPQEPLHQESNRKQAVLQRLCTELENHVEQSLSVAAQGAPGRTLAPCYHLVNGAVREFCLSLEKAVLGFRTAVFQIV